MTWRNYMKIYDNKCMLLCIARRALVIYGTKHITNQSAPRRTVLVQQLKIAQLVNKFTTFYIIQRFIIMFIWALSQMNPVHTLIFYLRFISILSSHLCPAFSNDLLLSFFRTKFQFISHFSHTHHTACLYHPSSFNHPNNAWQRQKIMKLLIVQFSSSSCYLFPSNSTILLRNLFSNTLNLCSSLKQEK
jgi:hypothetical protein